MMLQPVSLWEVEKTINLPFFNIKEARSTKVVLSRSKNMMKKIILMTFLVMTGVSQAKQVDCRKDKCEPITYDNIQYDFEHIFCGKRDKERGGLVGGHLLSGCRKVDQSFQCRRFFAKNVTKNKDKSLRSSEIYWDATGERKRGGSQFFSLRETQDSIAQKLHEVLLNNKDIMRKKPPNSLYKYCIPKTTQVNGSGFPYNVDVVVFQKESHPVVVSAFPSKTCTGQRLVPPSDFQPVDSSYENDLQSKTGRVKRSFSPDSAVSSAHSPASDSRDGLSPKGSPRDIESEDFPEAAHVSLSLPSVTNPEVPESWEDLLDDEEPTQDRASSVTNPEVPESWEDLLDDEGPAKDRALQLDHTRFTPR